MNIHIRYISDTSDKPSHLYKNCAGSFGEQLIDTHPESGRYYEAHISHVLSSDGETTVYYIAYPLTKEPTHAP